MIFDNELMFLDNKPIGTESNIIKVGIGNGEPEMWLVISGKIKTEITATLETARKEDMSDKKTLDSYTVKPEDLPLRRRVPIGVLGYLQLKTSGGTPQPRTLDEGNVHATLVIDADIK